MQPKVLTLLVFMLASVVCEACCLFGSSAKMVDQENLIVWDHEKKVEHFVRRATFSAAGNKVGFVAPTPSIPELGEVTPEIFKITDKIVSTHLGKNWTKEGLIPTGAPLASGGPKIEQVVSVAGYKAVTLSAKSGADVQKWLKENQFASFEGEKEWFDFYLGWNWYLTFFFVERSGDADLKTGTVRMSFKTEHPFNPYYVPKGNQNQNARLYLYFVSQEPYRPLINVNPEKQKTSRFRMTNDSYREMQQNLTGIEVNMNRPVMYAFKDFQFAQGARDDLFFAPDLGAKVEDEKGRVSNTSGSNNGAMIAISGILLFAILAVVIVVKKHQSS